MTLQQNCRRQIRHKNSQRGADLRPDLRLADSPIQGQGEFDRWTAQDSKKSVYVYKTECMISEAHKWLAASIPFSSWSLSFPASTDAPCWHAFGYNVSFGSNAKVLIIRSWADCRRFESHILFVRWSAILKVPHFWTYIVFVERHMICRLILGIRRSLSPCSCWNGHAKIGSCLTAIQGAVIFDEYGASDAWYIVPIINWHPGGLICGTEVEYMRIPITRWIRCWPIRGNYSTKCRMQVNRGWPIPSRGIGTIVCKAYGRLIGDGIRRLIAIVRTGRCQVLWDEL